MTLKSDLKLCPFCGGNPETDLQRCYRAITNGALGSAVSIYCTSCNADMMLCREDLPECDTEELYEILVDNWNKRNHPTPTQ